MLFLIIMQELKLIFDSYDSLLLEKTLTLHNVIILIKSVLIRIKVTATMIT